MTAPSLLGFPGVSLPQPGGPITLFTGAPPGGLVYIDAGGYAAVDALASLDGAGHLSIASLFLPVDPVTSLIVTIDATRRWIAQCRPDRYAHCRLSHGAGPQLGGATDD